MKCSMFNNFGSLREKINDYNYNAQKYFIGRQRTEYLKTLLHIVYCDGQFHIRTQGAWGVDVAISKCPQYTGELMVEAAHVASPAKEHDMTWATYNDHSGDGRKAKDWSITDNNMLILNGPSGLGKTHLARALQYQFVDGGKMVEWISAKKLKELLIDASPMNRERVADHYEAKSKFRRLKKADILIIDDLGDESKSGVVDTVATGLKELLDEAAGRMVITMNLSIIDENKVGSLGMYGGRIYSRITGGAKTMNLKGTDYRQKGFKS